MIQSFFFFSFYIWASEYHCSALMGCLDQRFNHQKIIKNSPEHWWEEWFLSIAALMDCSFRFRFTHKIFYHLWDRWFLSIIDGQLDLSNDTVGTGSPSHWLATMSINHQPLIIMITEKIHLGKTALSVNSNSFLRNLTDKLARLCHGNKDTVGTGSLYHDVNQHLIRYIK